MDPRPEVHACLSLAARHLKTADLWLVRHRGRLESKHRSKAQKHLARAKRLEQGEA